MSMTMPTESQIKFKTLEPVTLFAVATKEPAMVKWLETIPLTDWPQQHPQNGELKPAMVHQRDWHGFGEQADHVIERLLEGLTDEIRADNPMLSIVMPGHDILEHKDQFGVGWLFRIHVPLQTNRECYMRVDGEDFQLAPYCAYIVDVSKMHSVRNNGDTPRIHFMFDCWEV